MTGMILRAPFVLLGRVPLILLGRMFTAIGNGLDRLGSACPGFDRW